MKKGLAVFLILVILLQCTGAIPRQEGSFVDVPKGDFFESYIYRLKELNITNGLGEGVFGYDKNITRAEFLTFLIRLQKIELDSDNNIDMFSDTLQTDWYYPYIKIGLKNSIIRREEYSNDIFEPGKLITREEMAVMIVRALGLDNLAAAVGNHTSQFKDVHQHVGYIELAKDLGIINGRGKDNFAPQASALRQEAAAMLIRMYDVLDNKLDVLHSFYAIKSFDQAARIKDFDSIGFGWSRLEYNGTSDMVELSNTKQADKHPFYIPEDYQLIWKQSEDSNPVKYLMVFGTNEDFVNVGDVKKRLVSMFLENETARNKMVADIIKLANSLDGEGQAVSFDGVVIDFEGLRDNGTDKQNLVNFLTDLSKQLKEQGKSLMVCVNPPREKGQAYYDGYDFEAIGRLADYVVLMAHDYDAKFVDPSQQAFKGETPLAPIKDVYYGIKYALNNGAGVPKEKLLLQISYASTQWQFKDNALQSGAPYHPEYSRIVNRMRDSNVVQKSFEYSKLYEAPYFIYEVDGVKNIIWYENERSTKAKMDLAQLMGIGGVSFWRLGTIPGYSEAADDNLELDVWSVIESYQ